MPPGSKVLYLGAASGTTVSHVSDIVGPVSINIHPFVHPSIHSSACSFIHTFASFIRPFIHSFKRTASLSRAQLMLPKAHAQISFAFFQCFVIESYDKMLSDFVTYGHTGKYLPQSFVRTLLHPFCGASPRAKYFPISIPHIPTPSIST